MKQKLYTVKDITNILNSELEKGGVEEYRYTEQRVRARLRYLRSQAVYGNEKPSITPKIMGYDRRTKYYTDEDVEALKSIWVGPMLAEFHEFPEDVDIITSDEEEIDIRPATINDVEAITRISPPLAGNKSEIHNPIVRMLKEANSKTFVAVTYDDTVIGWCQARIDFANSIATGKVVGSIHFYIILGRKDTNFVARTLIHRADYWLARRGAYSLTLFVPTMFSNLYDEYLKNFFKNYIDEQNQMIIVNSF